MPDHGNKRKSGEMEPIMNEADIVEGFVARLGGSIEDPHWRPKVEKMLAGRAADWRDVIEAEGFDLSLIGPMLDLPVAFQTPGIAAVMGTRELMERFVALIDHLHKEDFPEKDELLPALEKAAPTWGNVTQALREIYLRLPLPPQVIPDDALFRYLPNGLAVLQADGVHGTAFHRDMPMMSRGRYQCYEWRGNPGALVMLGQYRKRWVIVSVGGVGIDEKHPIWSTIADHLRPHGIGLGSELMDLVELFLKLGDFDFRGLPIRFD